MGKPQVIKFEQNLCNANINDNSVLFVRVESVVQDKKAILEVPYTHYAYVIKGGSDCRFYDSGNYEIFEKEGLFSKYDKKEIKDMKNGLSIDVVYMPKDTSLMIYWGTPDRFIYRDKISAKIINIGASGSFTISIENHELFFRKIVGVQKEFDKNDFTKRVSAFVVSEFKDIFLQVVDEENLSYDEFEIARKKICDKIADILSEKMLNKFGVKIDEFIIERFVVDGTENVEKSIEERIEMGKFEDEKYKQYILEKENLQEKEWEKEKYLLELQQQDKNAQYDVAKAAVSGDNKGSNYCPHCGHSYENGQGFCTNCGKRLTQASVVCTNCGTINDGNATFCVKCGKKL